MKTEAGGEPGGTQEKRFTNVKCWSPFCKKRWGMGRRKNNLRSGGRLNREGTFAGREVLNRQKTGKEGCGGGGSVWETKWRSKGPCGGPGGSGK